jgi:hypothetical protein
MDPQETWNQLLDAVATRDWNQAEKLANAMLKWLRNRGDPPQTVSRKGLTRSWHAAVAQLVSYMAINSAGDARRRGKPKKEMWRWKTL